MTQARRVIISGEKGVGKTKFCRRLADLRQREGIKVRGLISPGMYEKGRKVGIKAVNLENYHARPLAYTIDKTTNRPSTSSWSFVHETLQWGNRVLKRSVPCDLLIIDELGPLEFDRGEGWENGLRIVDGGRFEMGVIVVRPGHIDQVLDRWPAALEINIHTSKDIAHLARELFQGLFVGGDFIP